MAAAFRAKGIPEFLPQYRASRRWTDRTRLLEMPLFPGYLFCRFERGQSPAVRHTPGVLQVVGVGGRPMPIPEEEIESIRAAVESGRPLQPYAYVAAGSRVRIDRGPLAGVTGVVIRERDEVRVIVSIELLQRSVAVELEREAIALD